MAKSAANNGAYIGFTDWEEADGKPGLIKAKMKQILDKSKSFDFGKDTKLETAYTETDKSGSPAVRCTLKDLADNREFPFVISYGKIHFKAGQMSLEQMKNLRSFLHFNSIENFVLPEELDENIAEAFKRAEKEENILKVKEAAMNNPLPKVDEKDAGESNFMNGGFELETLDVPEIKFPEYVPGIRGRNIPVEKQKPSAAKKAGAAKKERPEECLKRILETDAGKILYKDGKNMLYSFSITGLATFKLYDGDDYLDSKDKAKKPTAVLYLKQTRNGLNINCASFGPTSEDNANIIMKVFKEMGIQRVDISGVKDGNQNTMAAAAAKNLRIPTGVDFPQTRINDMLKALEIKAFNDEQLLDYKEKWLKEMDYQASIRGKTYDKDWLDQQKARGAQNLPSLHNSYQKYESLQNDVLKLKAKSLLPLDEKIDLTPDRMEIILKTLKDQGYGSSETIAYKEHLIGIIEKQAEARGTELSSKKHEEDSIEYEKKKEEGVKLKPLDKISQHYEVMCDEVRIGKFKNSFYKVVMKAELEKAGQEQPNYEQSKKGFYDKYPDSNMPNNAIITIGIVSASAEMLNMINNATTIKEMLELQKLKKSEMEFFNKDFGAHQKNEKIDEATGKPVDIDNGTGKPVNPYDASSNKQNRNWELSKIKLPEEFEDIEKIFKDYKDKDTITIDKLSHKDMEKLYSCLKEINKVKAYRDLVETHMENGPVVTNYNIANTISGLISEASKSLTNAANKARSDGSVNYDIPSIKLHDINRDMFEQKHYLERNRSTKKDNKKEQDPELVKKAIMNVPGNSR